MGDQSTEANKDVRGHIQGPSSSDSVAESSATDSFRRLFEDSEYPGYFRLATDCANALKSASVSDSGGMTLGCRV